MSSVQHSPSYKSKVFLTFELKSSFQIHQNNYMSTNDSCSNSGNTCLRFRTSPFDPLYSLFVFFYLSTPWTVLQLIKNIESGYVAMNLNVFQIHQFKSNKLLQSSFSNNHLILSSYL